MSIADIRRLLVGQYDSYFRMYRITRERFRCSDKFDGYHRSYWKGLRFIAFARRPEMVNLHISDSRMRVLAVDDEERIA